MDKYKVYNKTKNQWEHVIADAIPTTCPDNPGDTMKSGSAVVTERGVQIWDGVTVRDLTLANYKVLAVNAIDYKSGVLLAPGVLHLGNYYSASTTAITKNLGIDSMLTKSITTFPVTVSRIDQFKTVFNNQAEWDAFISDYSLRVDGVLGPGAELKDDIENAVDEAAVDAVVDTRT